VRRSDGDVLVNRPDGVSQPGGVPGQSAAAGRGVRPSPRSEFGGRRRRRPPPPLTAVETAPTPPPLPARKPQPAVCTQPATDTHLQQLLTADERELVLCDARRQNTATTSGFAPDWSCVVAAESCVVPIANFANRAANSSTPVEPHPVNNLKSRTAGPRADGAQQSAVCAGAGSFAGRLNQPTTQRERPGLQSTDTFYTPAERRNPADIADGAFYHPRESFPCQRDLVFSHVPTAAAAAVCESGALAKVGRNAALGNGESAHSAVGDEIFLPPPPEFGDSFSASCSAVSVRRSDSARDSDVDDWTVDEVCNWLDSIGFCQHRASFGMQNVNGAQLKALGRSELIALGLTDVFDRMKFERALMKMSNI